MTSPPAPPLPPIPAVPPPPPRTFALSKTMTSPISVTEPPSPPSAPMVSLLFAPSPPEIDPSTIIRGDSISIETPVWLTIIPSMVALVVHTRRRSPVAIILSPTATYSVLYDLVPVRDVSAGSAAALKPDTANAATGMRKADLSSVLAFITLSFYAPGRLEVHLAGGHSSELAHRITLPDLVTRSRIYWLLRRLSNQLFYW